MVLSSERIADSRLLRVSSKLVAKDGVFGK
jgi:hypothetical protein